MNGTWLRKLAAAAVCMLAAAAHSTTPHTITIDGTNDFAADEDVAGTSGSTWFFTWDASNFYFGVDASDVSGGSSTKFVVLYLDKDVLATPQSGSGTSTGLLYNTQQPSLPFNSDYHFRWKADGTYTNLQQWNGSNWVDGAAVSAAQNGTYLEVSIPRTALGSPNGLYVAGALLNEQPFAEYTYFMMPNTNAEGYDSNFTDYRGWLLQNGVSPETAGSLNVVLPVSVSAFSLD